MSGSRLLKEPSKAIRAALHGVGYSSDFLEVDYQFAPNALPTPEAAPADVVAFYAEPHDQSTSAVAVRWQAETQDMGYLRPLRDLLWAPYAIIARGSECDIWDTLPTDNQGTEPRLVAAHISYAGLATTLSEHGNELGQLAVARKKRRWRQTALYEADPAANAFTRWAYRPTVDLLTQVLSAVFQEARRDLRQGDYLLAEHLRWLLRLIGVRIAWDKRWEDAGDRTDPTALLDAARDYPTHAATMTDIGRDDAERLASVVARRLSATHLGAADGGILSQIMQDHAISGDLRHAWKLYPTPRHIAWHMVSAVPFETLPVDQRRVWDGTCGTGTILVAALDRLRSLVPELPLPELRAAMTRLLSGNDQAPAMTDATRIALDLTLGAPVGADWKISTGDVTEIAFADWRPNVIVGNPPFYGHGWTVNTAVGMLRQYADALPVGGLMSVIVPASIRSAESAKAIRQTLVTQFDWYEITELPSQTFQGMDHNALILTGRKRAATSTDASVVTWRRVAREGKTLSVEALQQREWLEDKRTPIVSPLALRLRHHLNRFRPLAAFIPDTNLTVGITPGANGQDDVLHTPEAGTVRYLTGQACIAPFSIAWTQHPRWLRYPSSRLQWDRRPKERLFQSPKIILTRQGRGRSAWRTQAAVDDEGLYPSDSFIALAPTDILNLHCLAGIFNSSLFNCWLDLINATGVVTLPQLRQWPTPEDAAAIDRISQLAQALQQERTSSATAAGERLLRLTLKLDDAVLDAYDIPTNLRAEIANYMLSCNANRPGFDSVALSRPPLSSAQDAFTREHAGRLQELFDAREERDLTSWEHDEMERLVAEWQRSAAAAARKHVPAPPERTSAGVA
jgi:hypothetical protein